MSEQLNKELHISDEENLATGNNMNTSTISNSSDLINPISSVRLKSDVDPATITNIQVSTTGSNLTSSSLSDLEQDNHRSLKHNSPTKTSRSSTFSLSQDLVHNSNNNKLRNTSHSKLSDLAHKVTDYLFSTRRSIDIQNPNCSSSTDSSSKHGSANPSPVPSRDNSHVSLSSLARNGGRQLKTKRRSFLLRSSLSPSRDSNLINSGINSHTNSNNNNSSTSLYSNAMRLQSHQNCHFDCNESHEMLKPNSTHVKETHYVHVEYDPITRKRVLNTYEILNDLGAGQHGRVKLAKDISTDKLVAIKIVDRTGKPALMLNRLSRKSGPSQEDKIRKEIAIMKKCDHPHVVKLIEVLDAESSRKIYLVLEYLEKGEVKWQLTPDEIKNKIQSSISGDITIDDIIPEPLLSLDETKKIFRDVISGLEYLHYQGIIHRDIKPSNLLVSKDNEVKISDFGVSFAANLDGQHQDDLELAKTAGTPAFLAPELCSTNGKSMKVTYKIDIWALGVTLYCLIFGDLPFSADSEYQLFEKINNDEVKFRDMTRWRVAKKLSTEDFEIVKDLLLKLLNKNPDDRIEIDEIKNHPFVLNSLNGGVWQDEYTGWHRDMKIDVSNQEMDEAVVGLGNRIKKKISDVLRRRKTLENDSSYDSMHDNISKHKKDTYPNPLARNSLLFGLKDDCSYILSEETNKHSESSMSYLQSDALKSSASNSKNATKESVVNHCLESPASNTLHVPTSNKLGSPLCESSPCSNIDDTSSFEEDGDTVLNHPKDEHEECEEEYDYRKQLERDDERRNIESVQLTVNPSFASLDSYYDDSYAKFMSPTAPNNSTFSYIGSYTNRSTGIPNRGAIRIPPTTSGKGSPNFLPTDSLTHHADTRESSNIARKYSNSPSAVPFMLGVSNQLNNLRGINVNKKSSPNQSLATTPVPQRSISNARQQGRPSAGPINPMINNINSTNSNFLNNKNSPKQRKRAVFSSLTDSNSSDGEDEPVNVSINKNRLDRDCGSNDSSKKSPYEHPSAGNLTLQNKQLSSRRAIFTSGNSDDEDDDDDDNGDDDFFSRRVIPRRIIDKINNKDNNNNNNLIDNNDYFAKRNIHTIVSTANTTAVNSDRDINNDDFNKNLTKNSIYGTKLNLTTHLTNHSTDDENNSGISDDELFISFSKRSVHEPMKYSNSKFSPPPIITTPKTVGNKNASYVSVDNVFSVSTPTIIDVPANIYESENSSNNVNSSFIVSKLGEITDEVAVLNFDDDGDACEQ